MRSIEFRYAVHRRRDVPIIPVSLRTKGKWKEVWAYVDSGSFYSIFDDKVAEILDIDLTTGDKVMAVVGDGSFIPIYLHTVGIKIGNDEFGMKIGFSSKLGVGFNLLGMDIFDRYRVIFDNRTKKIIFETYE
jgi:predicted aspartyl protease